MVHLAQVDAAGAHCPYLMEPAVLPRCDTGGQLSAAQGRVPAVSLSQQHQLSCSALAAPRALLTGLLGDSGGVVVKDEAGSWEAFCFQPTFL